MKKLTTIGVCCLLVAVSAASQGATHQVAQDGSGEFLTIGEGIAAATTGDVIVVGPGTYFEHLLVLDFDVTFRSEAGAAATVLDGEGLYHILELTGNNTVGVEGFTFTNALSYSCSALHIRNGAYATIEDCVFIHNVATYEAPAAFVRHAGTYASFSGCRFIENTATWNAGAVGVSQEGRADFTNCWFEGNHADHACGALATFGTSPLGVYGCVFVRNSGGSEGALRVMASSATITNSTFWENDSGAASVGIYDSSALFRNNLVVSELTGYGIAGYEGITGGCNLFYDNIAGSAATSVRTGDLEEEPYFCDYPNLDFHLCATSPAANAEGCGLIGALGVSCEHCGVVSEEIRSWGDVKSMFR